MDLGLNKLESYICGIDIADNYIDYKNVIGNDLYNRCFITVSALGRLIFDASFLTSAAKLAEGNSEDAGIAALVGGSVFVIDYALKKSRKWVISHKLAKRQDNSF